VRKLCLAAGMQFLVLGAGNAQKLELIQEPCITGASCRCPCTREGRPCPCKKKCGPSDKIINELVP